MADEIDQTNERESIVEERAIQRIREQAAKMPPGEPGECDFCFEQSPRLVHGVCPRCRDLHGLP